MSHKSKDYILSMVIIGALFFVFGFFTWLNGTLIPYLKIACELDSDLQSYLVTTAFFIAYTIMALPSARVLLATGYKKGMALGLVIIAIGALVFIPAANYRSYPIFLAGLFIIGTGLALLQTASNPYASIIGPMESAATRISIMGICNKVAGIIAGLVFGYIALSDADGLEKKMETMTELQKNEILNELAGRVVIPYLIISVILIILAYSILKSSLPEIKDEEIREEKNDTGKGKNHVLQFPHLLLGVFALFLYVGAEVISVDTLINYGKFHGMELSRARYLPQYSLGFMLIGYIIGIFSIPKYLSQTKALAISAVLGVAFSSGALLTNGIVSVAFISLLGMANALIWPAIWPLAIDGLGKFTKIGSALLVMAIAGGAILPLIYGWLSEQNEWTPQSAYILMLPCYIFIGFFALKGHQIGRG